MSKTFAKKRIISLSAIILILVLLVGAVCIYYFGKKYDFYNYSQTEVKIPGLNDGFIPQGLCTIDGTSGYLISGYMKDTNSPSRVYYVNKDGISKYVLIDTLSTNLNNGHFGGVAMYDEMVYLVSDGYLFNFSLSNILNAQNGDIIISLNFYETKINTDFCYARDGILYIGEFYKPKKYEVDKTHYVKISDTETNHGITLCYNIDTSKDSGLADTKPIKAISVPDQAQGMCITDSGKYVISTSYSLPDSLIYIYNTPSLSPNKITINGNDLDLYVLSTDILDKTIVAPCMSEGIDYENGRVHILFENACVKYKFFTRTREKNVQSIEVK